MQIKDIRTLTLYQIQSILMKYAIIINLRNINIFEQRNITIYTNIEYTKLRA